MAAQSPAFYRFYLNMWIMRKIEATELMVMVPTFLTQQEYEMIIATPRIPE